MDPLIYARTSAIVSSVADATSMWGYQRAYDLPRSERRRAQFAWVAAYGLLVLADEAIWSSISRRRRDDGYAASECCPGCNLETAAVLDSEIADLPLLPAHDLTLLRRIGALTAVWSVVWWAGMGVPARMRERGVSRPHRVLAPPLAVACAATMAPARWLHARDRAAAAIADRS